MEATGSKYRGRIISMGKIRKILNINKYLLLLVAFVYVAFPQGFIINGATFIVLNGVYVQVDNTNFINQNSGIVTVRGDANFIANQSISNTSGTITLYDSSYMSVEINFQNDDSLQVLDTAFLKVKGVLTNTGKARNEAVIQLGD